MNIVLIGPVYPYKGGISHYTGLMYKAFVNKGYDVNMVSYSMQYPKLLFHKEQKDYKNDSFKIDGTDFLINTANPINWIVSALKLKRMNPEFIIIQWWHPYFAPCYYTMCKILRQVCKVFVCHNVFPHERFPLDKMLTKMVLKQGNAYVVQSSLDEANLLEIKKNANFVRTVHPTYNAFKMRNIDKQTAREELGISSEAKILLFFGFVREYKGLKHIINALPSVVKKIDNIKLLIVGDFDGDKGTYLEQIDRNGVSDYISIIDGYIPDQEVEPFFAACDLVVLPYESATQSGIVQIAYGFEKPVIATNVGGLPEVVINEKTGYIVEPKNSEQLADRIIDFFLLDKEKEFMDGIRAEAYKYSWDSMVDKIEKLIKNGQ